MKLQVIPRGVFSRIACLLFALLFLMAGLQYLLLVFLWDRALSEQEQIPMPEVPRNLLFGNLLFGNALF